MSVNKVIFLGILTRDPEFKYTPSGSAVAECAMALNHKYKSGEEVKEEVCFIDFVVWGKQAEIFGHHCRKGQRLYIEGRLKQDTWEDKESGKNRSKLKVVVEKFEFIERKESRDPNTQTTSPPPSQYQAPQTTVPQTPDLQPNAQSFSGFAPPENTYGDETF